MGLKVFCLILTACLLLAGCTVPNSTMVSVEPHHESRQTVQDSSASAATYDELCQALEVIVSTGTENATIRMPDYPSQSIETSLQQACRYITREYPIGAYAIDEIHYEIGTSLGRPAAAVTVSYHHGRTEIQRIRIVRTEEEAQKAVTDALARFDQSVVILKPQETIQDVTKLVQTYARDNPQKIMEVPQVTETLYGYGAQRVAELIFTYQTDRDSLRRMQTQVKPVFDAAALYVSGDDADRQKHAQLYAFLMERFDYKLETSITPAYSLLRHGVGDSRAFATVYAAMCRAAGLSCQVITGTHDGEPRTWNLIELDGYFYHVDLLRCSELGGFQTFTDGQMQGYVWDYSSYPACTGYPEPTEETQPET